MDYPLPFHGDAMGAHIAANCALNQEKYWPMHDKLFVNQRALKPDDLRKYAEDLGLDMSAFDQCVADSAQRSEIQKDMAEGQKIGVRGTPDEVYQATLEVLNKSGGEGIILSLGGGVSPGMPRANIQAMLRALEAFNSRRVAA